MYSRLAWLLLALLLVQLAIAAPLLLHLRASGRREQRIGWLAIAGLIALPMFFIALLVYGMAGLWFLQLTDPRGILLIVLLLLVASAFVCGMVIAIKSLRRSLASAHNSPPAHDISP